MYKPKLVVLSGAGISAESGINTFREADGLWENHRIEDVASRDAWFKNIELVNRFYNERRKQLLEVEPNAGHYNLVKLEEKFDVTIVTQNVDDLHERAGSSNIVHLHGELKKVRSIIDENEVVELEGWKLTPKHICSKGKPMRPHIVWFGEMVPMITIAEKICAQADILVVIGTSLNVYPAANLIYHVPQNCELFLIDPNANKFSFNFPIQTFPCTASEGTQKLLDILMRKEN